MTTPDEAKREIRVSQKVAELRALVETYSPEERRAVMKEMHGVMVEMAAAVEAYLSDPERDGDELLWRLEDLEAKLWRVAREA